MKSQTAFVGDVHGNIAALLGMWPLISTHPVERVVFLGDYINKGPKSAHVISMLRQIADDDRVTLLRGNHEVALLDALAREDLAPFLKMGGAMTIRSYIERPVGPDVFPEFVAALPQEDAALLRGLEETYETHELIARHSPWKTPPRKYAISAHRPIGRVPRIGPGGAQIDTDCGNPGGRLTALMWPSLNYLQVDEYGELIRS
ncbi:serine/threonine protein phosphatase 1 [Microbacterium sp. SORGH_AS 1204]|uniref:metallophosphoesterase n=1 Tax=Microbacterium sp. SORGH_AS_1204 TaxID=3041785 RepID=UPI00278DC5BF|nr:metallophosphoesterase [Microbacterium sp. SORGH_AS_1204]MDQ1138344.1 serine/threonine protein phosphatase 1 [Microbacterium sp. SORGH_AS_1204]